MRIAAALSSAFLWALSSTRLASQTARVDFSSITALRAVWALLFLLVIVFALGSVLVLAGVVLDTIYGRARLASHVAPGRRNAISLCGHGALAVSGILGTGLTLHLFI